MKIEKQDARKVDKKTLQYLRNRAIKLREAGKTNKEGAQLLGIAPETASRWYSAYKRDGKKALVVKKTGRPKKSGKLLTDEQERDIIQKLIDTTPKQLKFKFALWTREAVKELIKHQTGIDMAISTVGYYLKRWQFTSKKPIKRAYERKDENIKRWLEKDYPKIKEEAKKEDAVIWWADETSCVSIPTNLKGYALKGAKIKPVLQHPAKKFKINMINAITNTGKMMFSLYEESINVERFIEFLQKVIDSSHKKVYLIVDNLRVHHPKRVKAWIKKHKKYIKLFYLPPYAPEFNPDEYLNQDYKKNANKNSIPSNIQELKTNTENFMNELSKNEKKVANYLN